jgi:hypothetical protein
MYFVEHKYAEDPTNWWIPNRACAEAMLRSAGFQITAHPEEEVFICRAVSNDERASLVHGFPLDWNHWQIHEWPDKLAEIRAVTSLPLWYSLYDLPRAWPATTRHREAEGSSYYRHFYMGLLREDGSAKLAIRRFHELTPVPMVSFRGSPAGSRGAVAQGCAEQWFDRQMRAPARSVRGFLRGAGAHVLLIAIAAIENGEYDPVPDPVILPTHLRIKHVRISQPLLAELGCLAGDGVACVLPMR